MRQRESAVVHRPIESVFLIVSEEWSAVLIGSVAIWTFCPIQLAGLPEERLASL